MNTVLISTLARQEHVINGDGSWPTTLSQIGWTKAHMTLRSTTLLVRLSTWEYEESMDLSSETDSRKMGRTKREECNLHWSLQWFWLRRWRVLVGVWDEKIKKTRAKCNPENQEHPSRGERLSQNLRKSGKGRADPALKNERKRSR